MSITHVPGIPLRNYDRLRLTEDDKLPAPPYCWQPPQILGVVSNGSTITAYDGVWTGNDPLTFNYQWSRDGVVVQDGASKTYVCNAADESGTMSLRVHASDELGRDWYAFSPSVNMNTYVPMTDVIRLYTLINVTLYHLSTWNGS